MWHRKATNFLSSLCATEGAPSVPGGTITLYGTAYAWLGLYYLGCDCLPSDAFRALVGETRDNDSGLFNGPELANYVAPSGVLHDRRHLQFHLTCSAVLPVAQQLGYKLPPIVVAHRYCDPKTLRRWMDAIDWKNAWFEGNNILFVGQLLLYLRDVEKRPEAEHALQRWFEWLDRTADPKTGLWGTNGYCSPMEAVYGGYHQLLVYYHENRPLPNIRGLVDTVLSLQHEDGSFNPHGNGGACEDVDSVDILVNCYKRLDYRRTEIRLALRHCLQHILATQNPDGGFPYNRDQTQSHMGIPGTEAGPNVSCTFPTWFRIHTLALIAEVLPNERELQGVPFRFNKALSMGWHGSPAGWIPVSDKVTLYERLLGTHKVLRRVFDLPGRLYGRTRRLGGRILRKVV